MSVGFFGSAMTVLMFVAFMIIVFWTFSSRRKKDFDDAANAPFALSDDAESPECSKPGKPLMNHRNVNHDE